MRSKGDTVSIYRFDDEAEEIIDLVLEHRGKIISTTTVKEISKMIEHIVEREIENFKESGKD